MSSIVPGIGDTPSSPREGFPKESSLELSPELEERHHSRGRVLHPEEGSESSWEGGWEGVSQRIFVGRATKSKDLMAEM